MAERSRWTVASVGECVVATGDAASARFISLLLLLRVTLLLLRSLPKGYHGISSLPTALRPSWGICCVPVVVGVLTCALIHKHHLPLLIHIIFYSRAERNATGTWCGRNSRRNRGRSSRVDVAAELRIVLQSSSSSSNSSALMMMMAWWKLSPVGGLDRQLIQRFPRRPLSYAVRATGAISSSVPTGFRRPTDPPLFSVRPETLWRPSRMVPLANGRFRSSQPEASEWRRTSTDHEKEADSKDHAAASNPAVVAAAQIKDPAILGTATKDDVLQEEVKHRRLSEVRYGRSSRGGEQIIVA
jgi:hypothetical protein